MNSFLNALLLAGSIQSVFLIVFLLRLNNRNRANRILALYIAIISSGLLLTFLSEISNDRSPYPQIILVLNFLYGPLLYLYLIAYLTERPFTFLKSAAHFIPALLTPLWLFAGFSQRGLWSVQHAQGLVYCALSALLTLRYYREVKVAVSKFPGENFRWILLLILINLTAWLLALVRLTAELLAGISTGTLSQIVPVLATLSVYAYGYFTILHKEALISLPSEKIISENKQGASLEELDDRLENFMNIERPWIDPELTLPLLSEQTGIPAYMITHIINDRRKSNFFNYINRYRVDAVRQLMADEKNDDLTVLQLAFQSGFGSKSTFNSVFKNMTETTPSQFRKKVRINRK